MPAQARTRTQSLRPAARALPCPGRGQPPAPAGLVGVEVEVEVETKPDRDAAHRPLGPVLIRVPELKKARRVTARRPSARLAEGRATVRRRRRLRREVRLAGTVLAFGLPLAWTALALWPRLANPPAGVPARLVGIEGVVAADEPAWPAPIEAVAAPAPPKVEPRPQTPVVLPGYVLPDDDRSQQEPAHAGS